MINKVIMFIVICLLLSLLVQFEAVFTSTTGHLCHFHESISLLQFKKALLDLNSSYSASFCDELSQYSYPKMISWNKSSSDCCTWDGITCHKITGHIIGLDLSCSMLAGVMHQNSSLFHLSHLQKLNLAYNDFSLSKVSPNIGRLSRLSHLNLAGSGFESIIPSELSHLSKLVLLDFSFNINLKISPRQFHVLLRNLSRVRVLCLNDMIIPAKLPENWSSSSLTYLNLGTTGIRGKVPKSIFHFPLLRKLVLNDNQDIRVNIPKRNRSHASSLKVLDLSYTKINADGFTDSIVSLGLLKSLSLADCELTGPFPNSVRNLSQIVQLDLAYNEFTGDFSSVISNFPEKLEILNFNGNSFTGQFPSHIGNLTQLRLSHNFLNGTLPFTMSELQKLRWLDLSGNGISGQIPTWLFSSPSMTHLDLSANRLAGPIIKFTEKSLVQINLSSNNLNGSIDFSVFKHLNKLENLKLSHNKLSFKVEGKSNVFFPDLLFLGLSTCRITEFPSFLINSKNLIFLDLSNNKLVGEIPYLIPWYPLHYLNLSQNSLSSLGSFKTLCNPGSLNTVPLINSLQFLDLSSNLFEELLPLSICSFKNLNILDLSHNNFMGAIPECYGGFSRGLQVFNLEKNDLDGMISMNFSKNKGLMYLNLKRNSLHGILPGSLGYCKNLKVLDVGNNRIKDIFPNLENVTHLEVLILKSNRFFGSISNIKTDFFFPKLRVFDLSYNDFNGALPIELLKSFIAMTTSDKIAEEARYIRMFRAPESQLYQYPISFTTKGEDFLFNGILTTLQAIDLSSNHFLGEIPEIIGNLNYLILLNLSHNFFCGPIPSTVGELGFLESLDLSFNLFEGTIPCQLVNMTFLEKLNLSQNRLVGQIPQGKQFNTFSNDSYSGNLGLCGFPLTIKCAESNLSLNHSQASSYQEDMHSCNWCEFTWKALLIGYIFGMICSLFFRKPRWFVRN